MLNDQVMFGESESICAYEKFFVCVWGWGWGCVYGVCGGMWGCVFCVYCVFVENVMFHCFHFVRLDFPPFFFLFFCFFFFVLFFNLFVEQFMFYRFCIGFPVLVVVCLF